MSKRKTRHLKALRLRENDTVLIVNTETNKFAWYADHVSDYLTEDNIAWSTGGEDMQKYYRKLVALGAIVVCL